MGKRNKSRAQPPTWKQRFTRRIRGIPGASFVLGAFHLIYTGWHYVPSLVEKAEHAQFAFDVFGYAGGDVPLLARIVASPLFGIALIVGGAAYAALAKEPEKKINPIVPKIAWGVVAVCACLMASVFMFDHFLRESGVVEQINEIKRERHITALQKSKIKNDISTIASKLARPIIFATVDNPEANNYCIELLATFASGGAQVVSSFPDPRLLACAPIRALSSTVKGVFFQVQDPSHPPEDVRLLLNTLKEADISARLVRNLDLPADGYMLTVGLK